MGRLGRSRAQPNTDGPPLALAALRIPLGDDGPAIEPQNLRHAIERFARQAFRGADPSSEFVDRLAGVYNQRRKAGGPHSSALKDALAIVLASPRFLYLVEPSGNKAHRPLTGNELAVRLAYFLWGGPPDATLRQLAAQGELSKPEVLDEQTTRLIGDARSAEFVKPFVHQWLRLDRLDFFRFNNERHPAFDDSIKMAARNEVYETFAYLLHQNESLKCLLKSDFVVVNGLMANYYGLSGVHGDAFRKVSLPAGSVRGGLLGMAAILAMGSNGETTSPVERAPWVLAQAPQ